MKELQFLSALPLMALMNPQPADAKSLDIRIDATTSAPLFRNEDYARLIAQRAANEVVQMQPGDYVTLRSFGAVGLDNITSYSVRLSRRSNTPQAVARIVAQRIIRMSQGGVRPQNSTEIVAMFEWGRFDCQPGDHIFVASDGVETGSVSANALLSGRSQLPSPRAGLLANCEVTMLGIGQTDEAALTSREVNNLIAAWSSFMRRAGARFVPIANP